MKKTKKTKKIVLYLNGNLGNAFSLMGLATDYAEAMNYDEYKLDEIISEMMSGNYRHLVTVFKKYYESIFELR